MKLRLGIICIAVSITFGTVAAVSLRWGIVATMFALGFALVGIGFLNQWADERERSRPYDREAVDG